MAVCPTCEAENPDDAYVCFNCGTRLKAEPPRIEPEVSSEQSGVGVATPQAAFAPNAEPPPVAMPRTAPPVAGPTKYCVNCGGQVPMHAAACPHCGTSQRPVQTYVAAKSKTTAGLLALFLGGIGVHKFYLGQTGAGVLYLLFCWSLIPSIIAFIEAIRFFTMSEESFNAQYAG